MIFQIENGLRSPKKAKNKLEELKSDTNRAQNQQNEHQKKSKWSKKYKDLNISKLNKAIVYFQLIRKLNC